MWNFVWIFQCHRKVLIDVRNYFNTEKYLFVNEALILICFLKTIGNYLSLNISFEYAYLRTIFLCPVFFHLLV